MPFPQRILGASKEQIDVSYLRAVRNGSRDVAVVVDAKTDGVPRPAGARHGEPVPAFVGVVVSGDRHELAELLRRRFPAHEAVDRLANETPEAGRFPVVILTDDGTSRTGIRFVSVPKPAR